MDLGFSSDHLFLTSSNSKVCDVQSHVLWEGYQSCGEVWAQQVPMFIPSYRRDLETNIVMVQSLESFSKNRWCVKQSCLTSNAPQVRANPWGRSDSTSSQFSCEGFSRFQEYYSTDEGPLKWLQLAMQVHATWGKHNTSYVCERCKRPGGIIQAAFAHSSTIAWKRLMTSPLDS